MTNPQNGSQRVTQRRIAELAGVSQSTVSLVLNGKADALSRIPAETRERVLRVIKEAEYVADPAARRLAGVGNRLIGVFTYEPAFPSASLDFYAALLTGIESEAEQLGYDLLLFTSAPVSGGRRSLFHESNRLRLADGCLLLGQEMDGSELERLVESGFPFVAIGRRDAAGVPYVAADYVTGTAELVARSWELGHRRVALLHRDIERCEPHVPRLVDLRLAVEQQLEAKQTEFEAALAEQADARKATEAELEKLVRQHFPLTPKEIIKTLNLRRPIYLDTARYGHFGRPDLPWEKTDMVDALLGRSSGESSEGETEGNDTETQPD